MNSKLQNDWLETTLGQYLIAHEQPKYDAIVTDTFGFNAVQLGMRHLNALKNSRMPHVLSTGNCDGDFYCESTYLPFAESTVDLLCLPHVLEFSENPHQSLREAERVLVPEGYLILTGFNPISTWGVKRILFNCNEYPWNGQFFTLSRIKDWLALLGMEYVHGSMCCHGLPVNNEKWQKRLGFIEKTTQRWFPMLGGVYFIVAKKRVANMNLIKPNWKKSIIKRGLVVNSSRNTQKTNSNRKTHGK